ncbi:hypothetical protein [Breznakiella homolactica]|uniref:Uncharacterized protein n=1 Tax=Breznakiella homolactica TaxID=2798577 RepID=A0A7T7XJ77_9SPIR|nr:hypothetical protein [Breznakiella homolactica]QQO07424.1 hypothetical protein JFL75_10660 [Breznakiella homolactica]
MNDKIPDLYSLIEQMPPESAAWGLLDAFDAVSNGLENPEALAAMDHVRDPRLESWKHLVRAIQAMYRDDPAGCRDTLDALADDAPPGVLKPLFRSWMAARGGGGGTSRELASAPVPVRNLYRKLLITPHPVTVLAEQAEEAFRHNMTDYFERLVCEVFRKLREQHRCDGPLLAVRYAQYCLSLLNDQGYSGTDFFPLLLRALGEADGLCVFGFALIGRDNEAAVRALRGALDAGDGEFLDSAMAAVIADAVSALGGRTDSPGGYRAAVMPRQRETVYSGQLELF